MDDKQLFGRIECLLFISGDPVDIGDLRQAMGLTELEVRMLLFKMQSEYASQQRGVMIYITDETVQMVSNPSYSEFVGRFYAPPQEKALSQSMLETLAIVAYKQPATRAEVEAIRGVRCEYAISQLLKQKLIEERGRRDTVGRPVLFGTTDAFLRLFGLNSICDLPDYSEFAEVTGDVSDGDQNVENV